MRARLISSLTVAFVLVAASSSVAQTISVSSFQLVGGGHVVAQRSYALTISGEVRVAFQGDPGAGCATHGVCGYSGTAIWKPAASASANIDVIRAGRRLTYLGFTDFTDASGAAGEIVHRLTPGMPAGVCADASAPQDPLAVTAHGATLTLAPDTTITGRCAGPIDADLARLVPRTAVPAGTFTRPRIRLDLTGTRTFTVHGFSGELTSTITVTGRRLRAETQPRTPSGRTHRIRFVSESLSLVHGSGSMQTLIAGAHDAAVCALLDSCGAHGLITWAVTPTSVYGQLWASGPASLPLRAYRIALGLERGRASRRIVVVGDVAWDDRGTVRESVTHAGVVCSDSTDGNRGFLQLVVWRDALHAVYAASTDGRSHCPGPRLEPFGSTRISGAIPLTRAGHQFSMHLAGTATETDDGYDLRQSGSLALTIKRGRITQRIETY